MEREVFPDAWSELSVREHLSSSYAHSFIAYLGDEPVGYCLYTSLFSEGELLRIATRGAYRRQGVAKKLLAALLESAKDDTVFLEVRSSNTPATMLYGSFGFEVYGTRANYYKNPTDNATLMKRPSV